MSKSIRSYYDWELSFRKRSPSIENPRSELDTPQQVNSIGIEERKFKDFLKEWKEKNL